MWMEIQAKKELNIFNYQTFLAILPFNPMNNLKLKL